MAVANNHGRQRWGKRDTNMVAIAAKAWGLDENRLGDADEHGQGAEPSGRQGIVRTD